MTVVEASTTLVQGVDAAIKVGKAGAELAVGRDINISGTKMGTVATVVSDASEVIGFIDLFKLKNVLATETNAEKRQSAVISKIFDVTLKANDALQDKQLTLGAHSWSLTSLTPSAVSNAQGTEQVPALLPGTYKVGGTTVTVTSLPESVTNLINTLPAAETLAAVVAATQATLDASVGSGTHDANRPGTPDAGMPDTRDATALPDRAPDLTLTPDVAAPVINTWRRGPGEIVVSTGSCGTVDSQSDGLVKLTDGCHVDTDDKIYTETDTLQWTLPPAQIMIPELRYSDLDLDTLWWDGGTLNVSSVISTTKLSRLPIVYVDQSAWQTSDPGVDYHTGYDHTGALLSPRSGEIQPAAGLVLLLKACDRGVFHNHSTSRSDSPVVFQLVIKVDQGGADYEQVIARYTYTKE
jgi:hypothetical protein